MGTSLAAQVAKTCAALAGRLPAEPAAAIGAIGAACHGPLQIAVAGRVNSGKSTVVNALIGQRVAPTDHRECTTLVTVFRHGPSESVEVVLRNGDRRECPLDPDGLVPTRLPGGATAAEVAHIEVTLANANLREVTVIDTPGLASARVENSARSAEFLGLERDDPASVSAASGAGAVLYVFTQAVRADDLDAVRGFRAVSAQVGTSPANAVGVLNKADKLGDGTSLADAIKLADRQSGALRRDLAAVVPMVGLLAETVEAGRFSEAHAESLRAIAALSAGELMSLTFSADRFLRDDCAVPRTGRVELLDRLDLFGISAAVQSIRGGRATASELRSALLQTSGLASVRELVGTQFVARTDALKAADALGRLRRLARTTCDVQAARAISAEVERLLLEPDAHVLAELAAGADLATGTVRLPDELADAAVLLIGAASPAERLSLPSTASTSELADAAAAAANRWRSFANLGAAPQQIRLAMVLHRSAALLYQSLAGRAEAHS